MRARSARARTTLGRGSAPSTAQKALATKNASSLFRARESLREGENAGSEAAEDYASRAYPATDVTFDQTLGAIAAAKKLKARDPSSTSKWDSLGPDTLDVDRLGTQTYLRPTQWSGRVTALAVGPKCNANECTLYVGAAGGGVWRSKNALARSPPGSSSRTTSRRTRSARSPSTRTIRRAGRSMSARARRTGAATASPASASTRRPTTARTGRGWRDRSPRPATARSAPSRSTRPTRITSSSPPATETAGSARTAARRAQQGLLGIYRRTTAA